MPFLALNGAVLPASIKMIGEPFYRPLLQGCPDVPKYPELPFPHSPVGGRAANHTSYVYAVGTLPIIPTIQKAGIEKGTTIHPVCMQ